MIILLGWIFRNLERIVNRCKKEYILSLMNKKGEKIYIGDNCHFTPKTILLGSHIYIGANAVFQSVHGFIEIGNHVMFGPGCHIHGGNHEFHEIGKNIDESGNKSLGDDGKVIIEDDCWIGSNSIILKGVRIGRGSVIGAGSIVTKDIPPYTIYINKITPIYKKRFNSDEIQMHESIQLKRINAN